MCHLLSVAVALVALVALVVVCAGCARRVAETGCCVRQVRQPHHLLGHSVLAVAPHHPLGLVVREHVHRSHLTAGPGLARAHRVQDVGLTRVRGRPLLDDRGHPRIRHLHSPEAGGIELVRVFKIRVYFITKHENNI